MDENEMALLLEVMRRRLKVRVTANRNNDEIRAEIVVDGLAIGGAFVFTPDHWRKILDKGE